MRGHVMTSQASAAAARKELKELQEARFSPLAYYFLNTSSEVNLNASL